MAGVVARVGAAGAVAQAVIGSGFGPKKCIRIENHTDKKIRFTSNFHDVDVDAGRSVEVDWAYAILGFFGTTPDVTIRWVTSQGEYSQLVVEGSLIRVHADGTHDILGPGSWQAP
mmetsp:Transcript_16945/g.46679  ORF Transcript_16945/g.46679 Transcript_16945/m.46679 type:complete len:115 (-) Transcript_16945:107-451(-)|eukprot:CAMPEP_0179144692 /NCGR_PEP_ID=MMETSP0796-20121207/69736_1 /TAXON_ID=73915 /ORGANISM="Pyrodinium bahamense, Strain pbaha01" /LENGTH=114 /DNA_ID=CAMNT_0020844961 /DNA_START=76 /DNA_END=420 /DNA_ORIENTATION=+